MSPFMNGSAHAGVDPTAARRPLDAVEVHSDNVKYTDDHIIASYEQAKSHVEVKDGKYHVKPYTKSYAFKTERKVPKTGSVHPTDQRIMLC